MKSAPPTSDEAARLQALREYDVLDTQAEKFFDDLTLLASEICGTPIALISLIDSDRQWFKSKVGLDAEETSRDIAFCSHAIHQQHIFEVCDTLKDIRFFDNPLVTSDPHIRFYAGTPLLTPGGYAIGTLCAIDSQPRILTPGQRQALETLGHSVVANLELHKKNRQLMEANQLKTEFLSDMSHELRTPLNAIIGYSQIMQEEVKTHNLPSKFGRYLEHMDYSGKRLLSIINSVLDLSKIEEGKMHLSLSSVDCRKLFAQIAGLFSAMVKEKGIQFKIEVDPTSAEHLILDETKVSQIVINLINNAVKFTPSGKAVTVSILSSESQLFIIVKDDGVGINKKDQQKLFNKFQQVGKAKIGEGTGLGLAITKGLVELMGGSIKLSSREGVGSLFKVTIPHQQGEIALSLSPSSSPLDVCLNSTILLVEDNLINQEVAKAIFHSMGLTIELTDSGEQALELLKNNRYDLIFMDIHLPGIDGIETTRRIKQLYPLTVVIGLSADTFEQERFAHGIGETTQQMDDYLSKPVERAKLITVLNTYLPGAAAPQEPANC
ncbi:MAG: signal transduction histidine kinase/CheY-like chemotaxis protein [Paraglaciecola sp.]|jgi:signal transduction histidine kinase/CheY-like chemotaxis protein